MGTEVLRPQDCLIHRIRVAPAVLPHHRRKNFYGNSNPKAGGRRPAVRPEQKKRPDNNGQPEFGSRRSASLDDLRKTRGNNHGHTVMGQVTILRRGESLETKIGSAAGDNFQNRVEKKAGDGPVLFGTGRLAPDPEMVPKQIRIGDSRSDVYAGSAFSMSPSPRSLPLPSFFSKQQISRVAVDDSATRDLRRLLRLE
ncbi:uncharacterized protein LOC127800278 [Diospyros lotus]|uniref:uncharacterized protein LOC127800278 n=1 Tax=Diospyros lotus TaxID=55363 RepID=UPI00224E3A5E|nr:uncharacterized protein LOC127800278 [Diospyros lotus]